MECETISFRRPYFRRHTIYLFRGNESGVKLGLVSGGNEEACCLALRMAAISRKKTALPGKGTGPEPNWREVFAAQRKRNDSISRGDTPAFMPATASDRGSEPSLARPAREPRITPRSGSTPRTEALSEGATARTSTAANVFLSSRGSCLFQTSPDRELEELALAVIHSASLGQVCRTEVLHQSQPHSTGSLASLTPVPSLVVASLQCLTLVPLLVQRHD